MRCSNRLLREKYRNNFLIENNLKFPFSNLTKKEWLNLGLLAILIYYVIKIIFEIYTKNTFMVFGGDFLSFWSAGYLANKYGYKAVYDLNQISSIEYLYIPKPLNVDNYQFIGLPTIFLPIFLTPFQLLAIFPLPISFIVWCIINFFGYILYLYWFSYRLNLKINKKIILIFLLFFPFYISFYWGQIGLFLLIPIGEFYISFINNKFYKAGFWLSILLIKPQVLFLIILYLLWQKKWKCIISFSLSSSIIIIISLFLSGLSGIILWLKLLIKVSSTNIRSIGAMGMLNWRMVGLTINQLFNTSIGNWVVIIGILFTIILLIFILLPYNSDITNPNIYIAIFAATGLISPHFHIHSAIILAPFLLITYSKNPNIVYYWIFYPALFDFITNLYLISIKYIPSIINPQTQPGFIIGGITFILSIYTLYICKPTILSNWKLRVKTY